MKLALSYVSLKNIFKVIPFLIHANKIEKQLKLSNCIKYKVTGFLLKQYTMSLWSSKEDMVNFSSSGAHLDAMNYGFRNRISKEDRFLTIDSSELLDWDVAKKILEENGRSVGL